MGASHAHHSDAAGAQHPTGAPAEVRRPALTGDASSLSGDAGGKRGLDGDAVGPIATVCRRLAVREYTRRRTGANGVMRDPDSIIPPCCFNS